MDAQPEGGRKPRLVRAGKRLRFNRTAAVGAALIAASLALSGCATGQQAQTANETSVVDGVGATVGAIDIRDASVVSPSGPSYGVGANAFLQMSIINNAGTDDSLVSVTSSSAAQVLLFPNLAATFPRIELSSEAATPSGSAVASPLGSATGTASAPPTGVSVPTGDSATSSAPPPPVSTSPVSSLDLPAGGVVKIGNTSSSKIIQLDGLTSALFPATTIRLTFTFAHAGAVTLAMAVRLSTNAASPIVLPTSASSG